MLLKRGNIGVQEKNASQNAKKIWVKEKIFLIIKERLRPWVPLKLGNVWKTVNPLPHDSISDVTN